MESAAGVSTSRDRQAVPSVYHNDILVEEDAQNYVKKLLFMLLARYLKLKGAHSQG